MNLRIFEFSLVESMGEFFFNIDHGYLEALIRGFKSGLLTSTDYANLVQCETLEGNALQRAASEYSRGCFRFKAAHSVDRLRQFPGERAGKHHRAGDR